MADYEELVARLRSQARLERHYHTTGKTSDEAADAIEELSEDNAALNGVVTNLLEQLADFGKTFKWISVEERLPKESGYTIVFCADGDLRHVTFAKYQKTPRRWELSGARSYWRVLWWMPLPEPPKEEK